MQYGLFSSYHISKKGIKKVYLTYIIERKENCSPSISFPVLGENNIFVKFWKTIFSAPINETMTDEAIQTHYGRDTVMATVKRMSDGKIIEYKLSDFPVAEKLEKFMEDVK